MSYSQYDEEAAILKACPSMGRFLDVGAWHPKEKSNTRALYERGWSGVMIEPSPGPMRSLIQEYGNDKRIMLVSAALALESRPISLWATDDAVSTASNEVHETWKDAGGYYGKFSAIAITWSMVFNWFGGFDFINLDAEGLSVPLLQALMQTACRPRCICVEHDSRFVEVAQCTSGYVIALQNGTNIVLEKR